MHFVTTQNGMNIYHNCTHGCIRCDSRCYQTEHGFEGIEVRQNALELLEHTLRAARHAAHGGRNFSYLQMLRKHISKHLSFVNRK